MNFTFEFLDRSRAEETLPTLFDILYANEKALFPGAGYEAEKQSYLARVLPALQKEPRRIVLMRERGRLAGFFQYYVNRDRFMMEEIQFLPEYFGTGLFRALFSHLTCLLPEDVPYAEAFARPENERSQGILRHLGLVPTGEGSPEFTHFRGSYRILRERYAPKMQIERVQTPPGYDVLVGDGLLDRAGSLIRRVFSGRVCALVSDDVVSARYAARVKAALAEAGLEARAFSFPAGEKSKRFSTLERLLNGFAEASLTRGDLVIALGGGVTGDLTGFAASCYLRGVPYVQIPTTLLSAVDSSVGGKTAVDLDAGKNLAGAFYPPRLVICDTSVFKTLPAEVRACGLAEAVKMGVIGDRALFEAIEAGTATDEDTVARCVSQKARVVEADERDTGARRTLNLGHTYGHAVEALSGYTVPHGYAVAIGLSMASRAAARMGDMPEDEAKRVIAALVSLGLPTVCPYPAEDVARAALSDKKRADDKISVIVPERIGACRIQSVPVSRLTDYVRAGIEAF